MDGAVTIVGSVGRDEEIGVGVKAEDDHAGGVFGTTRSEPKHLVRRAVVVEGYRVCKDGGEESEDKVEWRHVDLRLVRLFDVEEDGGKIVLFLGGCGGMRVCC